MVTANFNMKLKRILCPKSRDPQRAMLDSNGNLLTSDEANQNRALEVYSKRLEANEMKENPKDLENDTNTLCEIRLKLNEKNKTEPWTMDDLKFTLKHLEVTNRGIQKGMQMNSSRKQWLGTTYF